MPIDELSSLQSRLTGKRVAIVHYAEHCPRDDGYRPARMGQLAEWLTESGAHVVRMVPTYSQFTRTQRPEDWTDSTSLEGVLRMIPTRAFGATRSPERLRFIKDLAQGAGRAVKELGPFDVIIVGVPPPGLVYALSKSTGGKVPLLADIRDLWPDALVPDSMAWAAPAAALIGRGLALELLRSDGVVAMSDTMLDRAPRKRRLRPIPLGISDSSASVGSHIDANAGMSVTFVGSFSKLFNFDAFLNGWRLFSESRNSDLADPVLHLIGGGELESVVAELIEGLPFVIKHGWIPSVDVPNQLARTDLGVIPTRSGQGTTLGNKALEYLGAGCYVLHSLEAEGAGALQPFGKQVQRNPVSWAEAFLTAEASIAEVRSARESRRDAALASFGGAAISQMWLSELATLVESA